MLQPPQQLLAAPEAEVHFVVLMLPLRSHCLLHYHAIEQLSY